MKNKAASNKTKEVLHKIHQQRADSMGVSHHTAGVFEYEEPLFLLAAKERARREGRSTEAVLSDYSRCLMESDYPKPECLTSDEILEIDEREKLPDARRAHLYTCDACKSLLAASQASDRNLEAFLRQVEEQTELASVFQERRPQIGWIPAFAGTFAGVIIAFVAAILLLKNYNGSFERRQVGSPSVLTLPTQDQGTSTGSLNIAIELQRLSETLRTNQASVKTLDLLLQDVIENQRLTAQEAENFRQTVSTLQQDLNGVRVSVDENKKLAVGASLVPFLTGTEKRYKVGDVIWGPSVSQVPPGGDLQWAESINFVVTNPEKINSAVNGWNAISEKELGIKPTGQAEAIIKAPNTDKVPGLGTSR
ncbi:MAG: hypothetical protein HY651_13155 [Acidobacteria bacterium]|nr:hypothetical protein [Acidobacteriota bacterium]